MPKKQKQESQQEQSTRFLKEVRKLIAAGELSDTEADRAVEGLLKRASKIK